MAYRLVGHGLQVGGPWPTGWWATAHRLVNPVVKHFVVIEIEYFPASLKAPELL